MALLRSETDKLITFVDKADRHALGNFEDKFNELKFINRATT